MSECIRLSQALINQASITPNDAGCQDMIIDELKPLGFKIETIVLGEVTNLWAVHGEGKPTFCFAGHTDVVPPGPIEDWETDPFDATIRDEKLFGRGAADMKTGIAAMLVAVKQFLKANPNPPFSIAFLITSNEEGDAVNGTRDVMAMLQARLVHIDWCIVGEPSATKTVGDTVKIGRRGSLHGYLTIFGKQGHIAYLDQQDNPIHRSFKALQALTEQTWDFKPNPHFPPTTMHISNLNAGVGADNVVPGKVDAMFNFRFGTATTAHHIQQTVEAILDKYQFKYQLDWRQTGKPFLTESGLLIESVKQSIETITQNTPTLSTTGGTSDGRFIAPTGTEVVELGVCNHSIHQVNEHVRLEDIETLQKIYEALLEDLVSRVQITVNKTVKVS